MDWLKNRMNGIFQNMRQDTTSEHWNDYARFDLIYCRVGREIPVAGIPSGNYREIPSWEIL
jgi:hypothetical protein